MAFVKVEDNQSRLKYVDPEKIVGYTIDKRAEDCHEIHLDAVGSLYKLPNTEKDHGGFPTREAASEYVEQWLTTVMRAVKKLEQQREEISREPYRLPQVGDIYRIHDRYWFITHIDVPSDAGVYNTYIALLMTEEERKPGGYNYTKTTSRMSTFFHAHAEWVGNTEPFMEAARQLLGSFYRGKGSLAYVLDGFTGREGMMVHYGLQGTDSTYCCHKKLPLEKGHVVTDNEHGVTCPQFDRGNSYQEAPPKGLFRVVHYALPQDNSPRCCDAKYPLPEDEIWMADKRHVTCPGDKLEHFWCDSTENHDPHIYDLKGEHVVKPRTVRCDGWPNPHNVESVDEANA